MTLLLLAMLMTPQNCRALDLSEVPTQLREKILQFHRVLATPDNFSTTSVRPLAEQQQPLEDEPRRYPLAGLQEDTGPPEVKTRPAEPEPLELQADLFRFSDRLVAPPAAAEGSDRGSPTQTILERMRESQSEMRRRLRKEWQQFQRWRRRQRRRRRMRRRIMKMLQRKLEKRFGPLPPGQWKTLQENSVFKTTKRIIRKKIRRLMRRKMKKRRRMRGHGGGRDKKKGKGERRRKRKERRRQRQQSKDDHL
jgi:hypothetical protein